MSYGASVGYQVPVGAARQAQVCPVGSFNYRKADALDFFGSEMKMSGRLFAVGLAVGAPFAAGATTSFVPFGSVSLASARGTVEFEGVKESSSETYGIVDVGAGFVFNRTVTLRPALSFPVGLEGSEATIGLSLGFNFGT
jgi:hypothetical protein